MPNRVAPPPGVYKTPQTLPTQDPQPGSLYRVALRNNFGSGLRCRGLPETARRSPRHAAMPQWSWEDEDGDAARARAVAIESRDLEALVWSAPAICVGHRRSSVVVGCRCRRGRRWGREFAKGGRSWASLGAAVFARFGRSAPYLGRVGQIRLFWARVCRWAPNSDRSRLIWPISDNLGRVLRTWHVSAGADLRTQPRISSFRIFVALSFSVVHRRHLAGGLALGEDSASSAASAKAALRGLALAGRLAPQPGATTVRADIQD